MSNKSYYVTEIFYSIQGEGLHVGRPSVFIRLFGCNLKCQGFGMPKGKLSNERNLIDVQNIDSIESLPLVHTGCDSYVAWDKRFRHLSKKMTVGDIANEIIKVTGKNELGDIHLVFTGGEPMLQQKLIFDIVHFLDDTNKSPKYLTIETNGTVPINKYTKELAIFYDLTLSVSQKLSSSGEPLNKRLKYKVLSDIFSKDKNYQSYLKFVISHNTDIDEINDIINNLKDTSNITNNDVYLMACGGTTKLYDVNSQHVANLALSQGYSYSPRLHIDLYGNAWST